MIIKNPASCIIYVELKGRCQEFFTRGIVFLDINLTKDFLKKTIIYSGFKNTYKKSAKQENSSLLVKSILLKGKMRVENQKKT